MSSCLLIVLSFLISSSIFADSIIDGGGNKLTLTQTGSLTIPSASKLTLRNITLRGLRGDRLSMINGTSKLVLDNAKIVLDGDYTFSQGSIEIINNSSIEGEHSFTFSGHKLIITEASKLTISNGTTFICTPTGGTRFPILLDGEEATLKLDGATFRNNGVGSTGEATGMILTNGRLEVDGTSVIDSIATNTDTALVLGTGLNGEGDTRFLIRPHAKLIVKNAGILYRNKLSSSFDSSGNLGTIELRDNGNFIIEDSHTPSASLGIEAKSPWYVMGNNALSLDSNFLYLNTSSLKGQTTTYGITSIAAGNKLGGITASDLSAVVTISPDGKYMVAKYPPGAEDELTAYSIDPTSGTPFVKIGTGATSATVYTAIRFSPDGRYVFAAGYTGGANTEILDVYTFIPTSATPLVKLGSSYSIPNGAGYPPARVITDMNVTPDGRFLAVATSRGSLGILVYDWHLIKFDPTQSTPLSEQGSPTLISTNVGYVVRGSAISPNGRYVIAGMDVDETMVFKIDTDSSKPFTKIPSSVFASYWSFSFSPCGHFILLGSGDYNISAYRFTPNNSTSLTFIDSISTAASVEDNSWSLDGRYIAVGLRAVGANDFGIYQFNASGGTSALTSLGTISLAGASARAAVRWLPSGKHLVVSAEETPGAGNDSIEIYEPVPNSVAGGFTIGGGTMKLGQDTELSNIKLKAS